MSTAQSACLLPTASSLNYNISIPLSSFLLPLYFSALHTLKHAYVRAHTHTHTHTRTAIPPSLSTLVMPGSEQSSFFAAWSQQPIQKHSRRETLAHTLPLPEFPLICWHLHTHFPIHMHACHTSKPHALSYTFTCSLASTHTLSLHSLFGALISTAQGLHWMYNVCAFCGSMCVYVGNGVVI